jgi:glucose 1-dehydrogenase
MKGLRGKTALVTGATGLIGGAVARRLAEEGATVIVASRSGARADEWIRQLGPASGDRCVPCELDLADAGAIRATVRDVARKTGPPTILVAAASLREGMATPAPELGIEHFGRLFAVDVAGHYLCARELVEHLGDRSASLVWLSSIYARAGVDHTLYPAGMAPTPVQYAAVKGAIGGVVTYLAAQWGRRNVRVNAVVAGGVRAPERQRADFVARYSEKTMLGRMGAAEEVAAAVVFLASEEAAYVTGTCLVVDGGFTGW